MAELEWTAVMDGRKVVRREARGNRGTYKVKFIRNNIYRVTVQERDLGQYRTSRDARKRAQEHEDGNQA